MEEIWKDIPNYEGIYQASNLGRIKSLHFNKEKIIIPILNKKNNYYYVSLHNNNLIKKKYIHKLVAETYLNKIQFKSMPDEDRTLIDLNDLEINHKDENKQNNNIKNLEWCTRKYNNNYGTRLKKSIEKQINNYRSKKIVQLDFNNNKVCIYLSSKEIERKLNIYHGSIIKCCKGKSKTAGGYKWKYYEEVKNESI